MDDILQSLIYPPSPAPDKTNLVLSAASYAKRRRPLSGNFPTMHLKLYIFIVRFCGERRYHGYHTSSAEGRDDNQL